VQQTTARSSRLAAWLPFGLWIAVIFGLSSIPDFGPPDVGVPLADKIAHLGEYAVLGALYARARSGGTRGARGAVAGAVLGACIGALDETYQRTTPGREVSILDAAADTLGAALGVVSWTRWLGPLETRLVRAVSKRGA
jgi:VanZ family protein